MKVLLLLCAAAAILSCGGQSTLGGACTKNADCTIGQTCFLAEPGGFCSHGCSILGSTTECPADSVCAYQGGTDLVCSPICTADSACRQEYACKALIVGGKSACAPK
ncbi:MAG: hypothetical protein K1X89_12175 [Myxococcaceae bacterium]|nr:hypothetical protein [Myxococcaceae bacterium]